ncbi:MAG: CapA family protein, partial [Candidatus Peregrinibacteria bacterium]
KDYIFENLDWSEFGENDVMFANLEGPISGVGKKGGTGMTFSFNEDVAQYLKDYGFNVLSIVNNHALDQGWAGRDSTIAAFENVDLGWCGHPTTEDFESVYYGVDGDITYAFICFDDVKGNVDMEAAKNLIWMTKSNVDYTIVSIHWGSEYKHQPHSVDQVEAGRAFVDAGADLVIGHHPHVVQSFETYNGAFIFYSLGNFVFDQYWSKDTQEELGIKAVFGEDDAYVQLFPLKSELSQVRLMDEDEKSVWIEEFIKYGNYGEELKEQIRSGIIPL